ncbi:hypothetical protein GCM10023149_05120 [Mucilaginibacter gynuensis]|uniref:Protein kinase domain-containing protein n=1 Tax=Mucilaginibacter gynuensis TaxID=1302236 RepID=A0ABP8FT53_9SPHI
MSKVFTIADGLENLGALRTGGQGSVYKGRRTGTIYSAVKLIPTPIYLESADDKNYRNFQNEVAKLQKVNEEPNPNVVKILSYGITESGSFPYIEMEYVEGPDLCELLQAPHDKIFTLKELIKVADQLACALLHCHNVGVKHGDIKSNNVKYNIHTGNYVLLDFGLAIMSDEQRRSSVRHAGAIEFMAPEQHEGKMLLQTDVYGYGVILFELLSGQVPFPLHGDGDTGRNAVMLGHIEGTIPDAMLLRENNLPETWSAEKKAQEMQVPAWLLEMVYTCLQKNPQDRYSDGSALHQAIVKGTLATANNPVTIDLKKENEQLHQQLLQYQTANTAAAVPLNISTDKVQLSKRAFAGLIGVAVLFLGLFLYAVLDKSKAVTATTTPITTTKPYRSPFIFVKYYNHDSVMRAKRDSIKAQRNALMRSTIDSVAQQEILKQQPPKKKKRKKFLGIF